MLLSEFIAEYPEQDRDIGEEVAKVAALAHTYDRTGKVTVEIKVAKSNRMVLVSLGAKTTEPQPDAEQGFFYMTRDGGLSKNDPDQLFDRNTGAITPTANPNLRED